MSRRLDLPAPVSLYSKAVTFFLTGDFERLEEIKIQLPVELKETPNEYKNALKSIVDFRLDLRLRRLKPAQITEFESQKFPDVLEAEKFFLAGAAWETLGEDDKTQERSMRASHEYERCECPRKGVKAMYNAIVAESRIYPYKNFVNEYQAVIQACEKIENFRFAGLAMVQLSREYQIVGLLEKAKQTVDQALENLKSERGSLHFGNALLQKAHIEIEMGAVPEARKLITEAQMSSFPEILAASELLSCLIERSRSWPKHMEKHLQPTWRERLALLKSDKLDLQLETNLTELETKLLKMLWSGPLEKWDLISRLYPDNEDSLILENRFKNLVARVRKKLPNTLQFNDGSYYIESKNLIRL